MKLGLSDRAICNNRPAMVVSLALVRPGNNVNARIFWRCEARMATGQKHSPPANEAVPGTLFSLPER